MLLALNEITQTAKVGILLDEALILIDEELKGACEILGLVPLSLTLSDYSSRGWVPLNH